MSEQRKQESGNWAARAAYWAKTAPESVSITDDLNQLLIELTEIRPGDHVLDLASGTGEPAISIALRVGGAGSVTALDAYPEMLAGAKRRAAKLDLTNISFEPGRMENLLFEDSRFDAVTCRFGLMSSDDPVATLRETRRVLKPGKKAGFMTHGANEKNTLSAVTGQVVNEILGDQGRDGRERRLRFSKKGSLLDVFDSAGFSDVQEREIVTTLNRDRGTRFWGAMLERRLGPKLEALSETQVEDLHAAIEIAFEPYLKGDHYEFLSAELVGYGKA